VKVTTILDNSVTGKLYSFCQVTNTIALVEDALTTRGKSQKPSSQSTTPNELPNYRIFKTSFVKDISLLEKSKASNANVQNALSQFLKATPTIGPVSVNAALRRESDAVKAVIEESITKGIGVTPEGQQIFNALYKTLPCRWHEKSIIVVDEVRIDPPYTVENCRADDPSVKSLGLVKKIVRGVREKIDAEVKGG
jgi:hypothetical protein